MTYGVQRIGPWLQKMNTTIRSWVFDIHFEDVKVEDTMMQTYLADYCFHRISIHRSKSGWTAEGSIHHAL